MLLIFFLPDGLLGHVQHLIGQGKKAPVPEGS
jgi:hypothetical protein